MFSFRSRKAQQDLQQFLLRVINRNGLAPAKALENNRHESRVNLKLGMWVIPLSDGFADIDSAFTALTVDFSSAGVSIVTNQAFSAEEVLLRMPADSSPRLVRATVCNRSSLGCGWEGYNLKAVELIEVDKYVECFQLDELLVT
jgi:hypothetical protein